VRIWSGEERVWVKNARRDPRIAFSIQEEKAPFAAVIMRGRAEVATGDDPEIAAEVRRDTAGTTATLAGSYVEWVWDPDPSDTTYTADFAYLLRDRSGQVRAERDLHLNGLFARDQWTDWLAGAGFWPEIRPARYDVEDGGGELFLARRVA